MKLFGSLDHHPEFRGERVGRGQLARGGCVWQRRHEVTPN